MTGKGGVGKTTLAALAIDVAGAHGEAPVLAVDADSNANLDEALGVRYEATVGGIRGKRAAAKCRRLEGRCQAGVPGPARARGLVEQSGFDLIVMGRPEGQGCYCFANNVLREVLDQLSRQLPPYRASTTKRAWSTSRAARC